MGWQLFLFFRVFGKSVEYSGRNEQTNEIVLRYSGVEVEFLREKLGQLPGNCLPRNQKRQSQPVGGFILKKLHAAETAFINSKTCSFGTRKLKLVLTDLRSGTKYSNNNTFNSIIELLPQLEFLSLYFLKLSRICIKLIKWKYYLYSLNLN